MTPDQIRQIIREELQNFIKEDKYLVDKLLKFNDGRNIQLGKTTGTKIGTETTQKLSFYGNTPISQKSVRPLSVGGITTDLASWGFYA